MTPRDNSEVIKASRSTECGHLCAQDGPSIDLYLAIAPCAASAGNLGGIISAIQTHEGKTFQPFGVRV